MVIGQIGRPHGVRGFVRVRPTGPTLETLMPGDGVTLRAADGGRRSATLVERVGDPARPVLRFEGCDTREHAAALTGALVEVADGRLAPIDDPDTHYVRDLLGCRVVTDGGRELGEVVEVHAAPANDALEVRGEGESVLIPFVARAVLRVDPAAGLIVVRDGLLGEG